MKRKLVITLAVLMGLSCMATGCGNGGNTQSAASTDGAASADASAASGKPIKILAPLLSDTAPSENSDLEKKLEELTGHEVEVTWVPDTSYTDKVSVVLASGELPDIIVAKGKDSNIISAVDDDTFWQLDDYIPKFDNLSQMNKDVNLNASFNGKTFGIYRSRDTMRAGIIIRRDWLKKLGLETPTTVEEFTEMLRAFKTKDPDGNGKDDTYGIAIPKWDGMNNFGPFDQIATWFGSPNAYKIDGDQVVPDFLTDQYNEYLDYAKSLYDEGLINQDFAVLSTDNWNDQFVNDKAGVIIDMQSRGMELSKLMAKKNGKEDEDGSEWVTMIANVKTKNGDFVLPTSGYSGMLMIPKSSVKDESRLMEVLDFINKSNSEECEILLNNGIEGVNYEYDASGKYKNLKIADEAAAAQDKANRASFAQLGTNVVKRDLPVELKGTQIETERIAIRDGEDVKAKAVFNPAEALISEVQTMKGATLNTIISDARTMYIAGQLDKAGYDAEIERWKTSGGNELMDDLNKLYKDNMANK